MRNNYDVIVVGGGGSGLAAAVSSASEGCSVLLLERYPELGGATGIAVGSMTANRTRIQEEAGVEDNLEAHTEDAGKFPPPEYEAQNNEEMRRWFLSHSADTIQWLMGMGLQFWGPNPEPPNRVPRMHNVIPGAKAYIAVLHSKLLNLGGEVKTNSPVVGLTKDNSRITGIIVQRDGKREEYAADLGVVLAAGDYANSADLISQHLGEEFAIIEGINPRATGDGHMLAKEAGAQLVNMDIAYGPELRFIPPKKKTFQQLLPTNPALAKIMSSVIKVLPDFLMNLFVRRLLVTWQHPENALFDDGAILINQNGERFCDETVWPDREIAIANQPDKISYIVLGDHLIRKYSQWPHFISTAPKIGYAYVNDYLRLRPDVAVRADQLDTLARKRGIPIQQLRETLEHTNDKRTDGTVPKLDPPYVLLGPAKAYFTTTEGGAEINKQFQVLDASGQPIQGLYAVGQNGLSGQVLWGHGLHISWAMTSGRLIGKELASLKEKR